MIDVQTGRKVGTLEMEGRAQEDPDGPGSRPIVHYRPVSTPVLNDGNWHHWVVPGERYRIGHDGTGWRVTCETWPAGTHIFRLATPGGAFADVLPGSDGPIPLKVGMTYEIRPDSRYGPWALYQAE